jgi:hypothetical protein
VHCIITIPRSTCASPLIVRIYFPDRKDTHWGRRVAAGRMMDPPARTGVPKQHRPCGRHTAWPLVALSCSPQNSVAAEIISGTPDRTVDGSRRWTAAAIGTKSGFSAQFILMLRLLPRGVDRILNARHVSAFSDENVNCPEALYRVGSLYRRRSHTRIRESYGFAEVRCVPNRVLQ